MSNEPQMFRVTDKQIEKIEEVDFAAFELHERYDIQEWIARNPDILGEDLLIISKEFSGFDQTNERLDLLAVDREGKLVVIELKRDDSGTDVHWQAIKYASYLPHTREEQIIQMLADHKEIPKPEAKSRLLAHLNAEDNLHALNHDQRIILVSHRFAPEVASAVLWLNEKAPGENLITCVQLIPYKDPKADTLYLQASVIIPVPGIDIVRVGSRSQEYGGRNPNADDDVTHFLRKVGKLTMDALSPELQPEKHSRWAGSYYDFRYYWFHFSREPWKRPSGYGTYYEIDLFRPDELESGKVAVNVLFRHNRQAGKEEKFVFQDILNNIRLSEGWQVGNDQDIWVEVGSGRLDDDTYAEKVADVLRELIQTITPVVDAIANESDGEEG